MLDASQVELASTTVLQQLHHELGVSHRSDVLGHLGIESRPVAADRVVGSHVASIARSPASQGQVSVVLDLAP